MSATDICVRERCTPLVPEFSRVDWLREEMQTLASATPPPPIAAALAHKAGCACIETQLPLSFLPGRRTAAAVAQACAASPALPTRAPRRPGWQTIPGWHNPFLRLDLPGRHPPVSVPACYMSCLPARGSAGPAPGCRLPSSAAQWCNPAACNDVGPLRVP